MDVVVPAVLRSRLGQLLGEFESFLQHKGYTTRRQDKQPGGHLTAWWLYARLDNQAPAKSEVWRRPPVIALLQNFLVFSVYSDTL